MNILPAMLALIALAGFAQPGQAQPRGGQGMGGAVERRTHDIQATDLVPVFPGTHACEPVASPYGSPYRFDGSLRRGDRNSGLHGGLDISLKEGTPLLAVAGGKVIARGEGGALEGNFVWLLHAPTDTGLPFWAFTKYQHLAQQASVNVGDAVAAGQVIGLSGLTGTIGPAFGPLGYPHLHLGLFVAPGADFVLEGIGNSSVSPKGGKLADPMLLFLPPGTNFGAIGDLPTAARRAAVAVVDAKGQIHPAASKVVWPVRCAERPR